MLRRTNSTSRAVVKGPWVGARSLKGFTFGRRSQYAPSESTWEEQVSAVLLQGGSPIGTDKLGVFAEWPMGSFQYWLTNFTDTWDVVRSPSWLGSLPRCDPDSGLHLFRHDQSGESFSPLPADIKTGHRTGVCTHSSSFSSGKMKIPVSMRSHSPHFCFCLCCCCLYPMCCGLQGLRQTLCPFMPLGLNLWC